MNVSIKTVLVVSLIALLCQPVDLFARPGGGGGTRPSGGSRPSAPSRPAPSSKPSPSRPAPSARPAPSRPTPSAKPAAGSRPSPSGDIRKNLPSKPSGKLSDAASRAPAGGLSGKGASAVADRAGSRPTQGDVQDFLKASGGNGAAANAAKSRVDAAKTTSGSAVSEFLNKKGDGAAAAAAATSSKNIADTRADAISNRTENRSDGRGSRGENRDFASDNREGRVSGRGDRQSVRVENRGDVRTDLASGRSDRRTTRQQNLGSQADSIRSQLNSAYDSGLHEEFWSGMQTGHYYFDKNPIFWSWAGFRTVSAIMPWNWNEGRYYDYGSGGGSYYDGTTVMADGEAVPAEEYAQQAEEIALSVPEEDTESSDASGDEWLPLGVFAVAQEGESSATPTMFMQLAVRKDGVIAGTYQNKETGETASLEGMVDGDSQRAAWTFSGKTSPIVETGIQNLTMNETQVLVHFDGGDSKTYLLVRVDNPEAKTTL